MQISSVRHPDSCCALCSMEHLLWQAGEEMGALGISDSHLLNNHRQGRVLVSDCGGIVFLPFLSQNMCCAHPGEKRS